MTNGSYIAYNTETDFLEEKLRLIVCTYVQLLFHTQEKQPILKFQKKICLKVLECNTSSTASLNFVLYFVFIS